MLQLSLWYFPSVTLPTGEDGYFSYPTVLLQNHQAYKNTKPKVVPFASLVNHKIMERVWKGSWPPVLFGAVTTITFAQWAGAASLETLNLQLSLARRFHQLGESDRGVKYLQPKPDYFDRLTWPALGLSWENHPQPRGFRGLVMCFW